MSLKKQVGIQQEIASFMQNQTMSLMDWSADPSAGSGTVGVGGVLRQAQQPCPSASSGTVLGCASTGSATVNFRWKEKKLNKYLVVCGFWCTFAAK